MSSRIEGKYNVSDIFIYSLTLLRRSKLRLHTRLGSPRAPAEAKRVAENNLIHLGMIRAAISIPDP